MLSSLDNIQCRSKSATPLCYYSKQQTNFAVQAVGVVSLAHNNQKMQLRLVASGRVRVSINGHAIPELSIAGKLLVVGWGVKLFGGDG